MSAQLPSNRSALALPPAPWRSLLITAAHVVWRLGKLASRRGVPKSVRRRFYQAKYDLTDLLTQHGYVTSVELQEHSGRLYEYFVFEIDGRRYSWHRPVSRNRSDVDRIRETAKPWQLSQKQRRRRRAKLPLESDVVDQIRSGVELLEWILAEAAEPGRGAGDEAARPS